MGESEEKAPGHPLAVPKQSQESIPDRKISPEEFITKWPLYTPLDDAEGFRTPERISFSCRQCGKETTWTVSDRQNSLTLYLIRYLCTLCANEHLTVIYRDSKWATKKITTGPRAGETRTVSVQLQKVGQYPALSIDIPKELEKNLGKGHTELYKRALINRNEGYGLGAVSYLRRVVEDKTDELIAVVAQQAEARSMDPKVIKPILAAKDQRTTFDQKLKAAALAFPQSLLVGTVNPMDVLYGLVSAGLHDLTEEQCIDVADEIKRVFEFTFTHLRAEVQDRKDFAEDVKRLSDKLAGIKVPKATPDEATKKPTDEAAGKN